MRFPTRFWAWVLFVAVASAGCVHPRNYERSFRRTYPPSRTWVEHSRELYLSHTAWSVTDGVPVVTIGPVTYEVVRADLATIPYEIVTVRGTTLTTEDRAQLPYQFGVGGLLTAAGIAGAYAFLPTRHPPRRLDREVGGAVVPVYDYAPRVEAERWFGASFGVLGAGIGVLYASFSAARAPQLRRTVSERREELQRRVHRDLMALAGTAVVVEVGGRRIEGRTDEHAMLTLRGGPEFSLDLLHAGARLEFPELGLSSAIEPPPETERWIRYAAVEQAIQQLGWERVAEYLEDRRMYGLQGVYAEFVERRERERRAEGVARTLRAVSVELWPYGLRFGMEPERVRRILGVSREAWTGDGRCYGTEKYEACFLFGAFLYRFRVMLTEQKAAEIGVHYGGFEELGSTWFGLRRDRLVLEALHAGGKLWVVYYHALVPGIEEFDELYAPEGRVRRLLQLLGF